MEEIYVVIKDGNRIVNWPFNSKTKIEKILSVYEAGYRPVHRGTVQLNGRRLLEAHLDCKLVYFSDKLDKFVFQVETIKPTKKEKSA